MTAVVDGRTVVPINLDALGAPRKPRMSATGILSIVLLCIAIVIVLVYLIKLAVDRRHVSKETVIVDAAGAATTEAEEEDVRVTAIPAMPAVQEVAVGAVTTAAPVPQGLGVDAVSADAGLSNLVDPNMRMEPQDGPSSLSLSSVMPSTWRGTAASAPGPLDELFGPLSGAAPGAYDAGQAALFASSAPTRELTVNAILMSNAVDRAGFDNIRPTNVPGMDTVFGIRPPASGISLTGGAAVFNASDAQMQALKTSTGGAYPVYSLAHG
jgi:hypothetical protein